MKAFYYNEADFTVDNIIANHPDTEKYYVEKNDIVRKLKLLRDDWNYLCETQPNQRYLDLSSGQKTLYARIRSLDKLHLFIGREAHGDNNPIVYKSFEEVK